MSDFWARRKAAVEAEVRAEEAEQRDLDLAERDAAVAEKSDEELLEELGLPDPDTLVEGDDIKAFLKDAVPARIKTRALRQLWRVNPVLANLDGLLDYGEDFTDAATVVENLQTAYQVGKGMTAHIEALAAQAEAEEADAEPEPEPEVETAEQEPEAGVTADAAAEAAPEGGSDKAAPYVFQDELPAGTADDIEPSRRRMRIAFDPQDTTDEKEPA